MTNRYKDFYRAVWNADAV